VLGSLFLLGLAYLSPYLPISPYISLYPLGPRGDPVSRKYSLGELEPFERRVLAELRGKISGRIYGVGASRERIAIGGVLGACMPTGVAGDARGPWPCHWHARITQRRHVGELEPESYFLGVGG